MGSFAGNAPLIYMNRKKILIVDDSEVILKTVSMKLTANGFDVVTAHDGSEAVSAVRREHPDLIMVDISFPPDVAHGGGVPWDGFLIMNWVKRLDEAVGVPFVVITGGDEENLRRRALAAGATAFFHKPLDHDELVNVIKRTLAEAEGTRQPVSSLKMAG